MKKIQILRIYILAINVLLAVGSISFFIYLICSNQASEDVLENLNLFSPINFLTYPLSFVYWSFSGAVTEPTGLLFGGPIIVYYFVRSIVLTVLSCFLFSKYSRGISISMIIIISWLYGARLLYFFMLLFYLISCAMSGYGFDRALNDTISIIPALISYLISYLICASMFVSLGLNLKYIKKQNRLKTNK